MPHNCDDFLKKVKTKKVFFALLGKGTAWKFYVEAEAVSLLDKGKYPEHMQVFSGKASWDKTRYKFAIDGDKDEAKKALKAAYTADNIKWDEHAVTVVGSEEDHASQATGGDAAQGAPPVPPPPITRETAAAVLRETELEDPNRHMPDAPAPPRPKEQVFQAAMTQLNHDWQSVVAEGLDTDHGLMARHNAVLAAIQAQDAKLIRLALGELVKHRDVLLAQREHNLERLVTRWVFRYFAEHQHLKNNKAIGGSGKPIREVALTGLVQELGLPKDKATALLDKILPTLTRSGVGKINPLLPEEARPKLEPEEIKALKAYTAAAYADINKSLWVKEKVPLEVETTYKGLQSAFAKVKPFPEPVAVERGLKFKTQKEVDAYLKPFQEAFATKKLLPLLGYLSCGTFGVPEAFKGQVKLAIVARKGLDVQACTRLVKERELLIEHGALVKVHSVRERMPNVWVIDLEQVLGKEK